MAWCGTFTPLGFNASSIRPNANPNPNPNPNRVQCFLHQAAADFGGSLDMANLTSCVVHRELAFTQGNQGQYATAPVPGKTLGLSAKLLSEYRGYF